MAVALLVPAMSSAQGTWSSADWDTDGTAGLTSDEVNAQFAATGTYDAWDRDDEVGLNEGEFATGMYANRDADNDLQITEDEYTAGAGRWYGPDYATPFTDYNVNQSGYIDRTEFGGAWDSEYYSRWDAGSDGLLSQDEFSTGTFGTADETSDMVVSIEEEGWFDGDDVEAEIQDVGDVMQACRFPMTGLVHASPFFAGREHCLKPDFRYPIQHPQTHCARPPQSRSPPVKIEHHCSGAELMHYSRREVWTGHCCHVSVIWGASNHSCSVVK